MNNLTREWLDCFERSKAAGECLADSIFWRLALYELPLGVDRDEPCVQVALTEIRESQQRRIGDR